MIDIDKEQRRASNPLSSVWVAASAGSGKTKVLTDRVLNLLLLNGRPDKLLCLTFTKAAAAEMSNRVNKTLKKWVVCPEAELVKALTKLLGETPDRDRLIRARRLFTEVLEVPGGMKIMTIHSFCQSVLARFPLEAGIPPNFDILDDVQADFLLDSALEEVLQNPDFQDDITLLSRYKTRDKLIELLQDLFEQRGRLMKLRETNGLSSIIHKIKCNLGIEKYDSENEIITDVFPLEEWPKIKEDNLNADGRMPAKPKNPEIARQAEIVAQNLQNFQLVQLTHALLHLAYTILERYQSRKKAAGLMDFDDLIATTKALLEKSYAAAWVLFKLDGGIDHILVDEAQDTNPDQWAIIRMIAEEFFAGEDHHDTLRTLFVVGDKKQSIYRFQGADPGEFEQMRLFFQEKITASQNDFEVVPFNLSFRSTQPILDVVNCLLDYPPARDGVLADGEKAPHVPYRSEDAGLVEVWPLIPYQGKETIDPWNPPKEIRSVESAKSILAKKIADKIADMIHSGEILESQARPIQAGDFLILVQRRNDFVPELVRLLKERHIPVMGVDRLDLSSHIAVKDLLAAAKFALLPCDDLNLACLLKSPLVKMTEDELFTAAYQRGKQPLWEAVQNKFPKQAECLKELLNMADKVTPYAFFATILGPMGGRQAFQARLGSESSEAIDEFLNLVLDYEQNEIPSLQKFVDRMTIRKTEIKRDMESGVNAVRIMTVHGSKGLQGNIVFLPQTRYIMPRTPSFLWLNHELPIWLPKKEMSTLKTDVLLDEEKQLAGEENRRLLYVAVTRAKDRLYICGYENDNKPQPGNWHDLITEALKDYAPDQDGIIRITSQQRKEPEQEEEKKQQDEAPLPDWAHQSAPIEQPLSKPLSPSKQEEEPTNNSPATPGQALALARGSFVHHLLQYLPSIPTEKWSTVIKRLQPKGIETPDNLSDLLQSERFAPIFGKNSFPEVPVVGVWQGKAFSGQIDRLVIFPNEVWIIDFKTNRSVPASQQEVPVGYQKQLEIYRGLISNIFSDKVIRTYLLWTENLTLMEITHEN